MAALQKISADTEHLNGMRKLYHTIAAAIGELPDI
jgi:hypothetical protein